ncbi:unnamed protein product [Lathyrus oleraceus]
MTMHICKLFLMGVLCITLLLSFGASDNDIEEPEPCIGGECFGCALRCFKFGYPKGECNLEALCCCIN